MAIGRFEEESEASTDVFIDNMTTIAPRVVTPYLTRKRDERCDTNSRHERGMTTLLGLSFAP